MKKNQEINFRKIKKFLQKIKIRQNNQVKDKK